MIATMQSAHERVAEVLDLVGAGPLALDALASVRQVEWSDQVTTAAIECHSRPRLLLNPGFVERYCATRERLAALLLHELAHVTLGHTRLFPRPTLLHNIAFDAVINRLVLTALKTAGLDLAPFAEFFTEIYEPDESPWFLLRPPPGWPEAPRWTASGGVAEPIRELHRRLYDPRVRSGTPDVTFGEIVALLREEHGEAGVDGVLGKDALERLLGAHGTTATEAAMISGDRDGKVVQWLPAIDRVLGRALTDSTQRGGGGALSSQQLPATRAASPLVVALRTLLGRSVMVGGRDSRRLEQVEVPCQSPMRDKDRRAPALQRLARHFGAPEPLLFAHTRTAMRRSPVRVSVYLDVSGSMGAMLEALHAALLPLRRTLVLKVWQFSTEVAEVSDREFERGRIRTTGGTDINCVVRHAVERAAHTTRVVVLTDGYAGQLQPQLVRDVRRIGLSVRLGITGGGPMLQDEPWVASSVRLPSLFGGL